MPPNYDCIEISSREEYRRKTREGLVDMASPSWFGFVVALCTEYDIQDINMN